MGAGQIPGGSSQAQLRPLTLTEGVVAVTDAETQLSAGGATTRNTIIQNNGPDVVQVYVTSGLGFGAGGIQLAPGSATVVGGIWERAQDVGVYQGVVYGICDTGLTASVSVTEEV